jgi:hypothetical protein
MTQAHRISRRRFCQTVSARIGLVGLAGALSSAGCNGGWGQDKASKDENSGLGAGASLGGRRLFPADNPWNQDISEEPVDADSATYIAGIGLNKPLHPDFGTTYHGELLGFPYVVVPGTQPKVPVRFVPDGEESDPGPYPVPLDAPVEAGSDRHVIVVERDNWKLYEMIGARREGEGWRANSGAIFDLNSNKFRPAGWTSANAAGLPILAGLVRYDEVVEQEGIQHALAFTCMRTRRAYVHPARHFASKSKDPSLPPMGMRVRLKADVDISGFPPLIQVILTALKKYGMMLAQNGGDWYMNGAHHPRWNDKEINTLKRIKGQQFEVVRMKEIVTG